MLSLRFVRENPSLVKKDLKKRGDKEKLPWIDEILKLDEEWRKLKLDSETLRKKRNELTQEVGKLKKEGKSARTGAVAGGGATHERSCPEVGV